MILKILIALFLYDVLKSILSIIIYPDKSKDKKKTFKERLKEKMDGSKLSR